MTSARGRDLAGVGADASPRAHAGLVSTAPLVVRNDWGRLTPPELGAWIPRLSVSVVVPVHVREGRGDDEKLALVLAALSRQTYPRHLFEVVVVDDGSDPPCRLPEIRPERCRLVRAFGGWGAGHARAFGAGVAEGDVLHWVDADVVLDPRHVEALARWHHLIPDAVAMGSLRLVESWHVTPDRLVSAPCVPDLFPRTRPHQWVEEVLEATDDLRRADHLAFRVHVGATASVRRELYVEAGGVAASLQLGQDTEFGYRLGQAGAVFVPDRAARAWHLGLTTMMRSRDVSTRYRLAVLADRMPLPRRYRGTGTGRIWSVPLVQAVVDVGRERFDVVRGCVDRLLSSSLEDLHVRLVGPWETLHDGLDDLDGPHGSADGLDGTAVLPDPDGHRHELRLLQANYAGEPRVRFAGTEPDAVVPGSEIPGSEVPGSVYPGSVFPAPYRLDVPARAGVGPETVARLVRELDRLRAGVAELSVDGAGTIRLWRTAAVARARRRADGRTRDLSGLVAQLHGRIALPARAGEVTDLARLGSAELAAPVRWPRADPRQARPFSTAVRSRLRRLARRLPGSRAAVRTAKLTAWRVRSALRRTSA